MSKNILDLDLKLNKKISIIDNYYFELCCPVIVDLFNECPGQNIGLKINKFVNIDNNIFEIDKMIIEGTNLTANVQIPANSEKCVYPIITDPIIKNNKLCIKKILLKVKPKCLKIIDNLSISLGDLSSIISINLKKIQITLTYTIQISNTTNIGDLEKNFKVEMAKKLNIDEKNITVEIILNTGTMSLNVKTYTLST